MTTVWERAKEALPKGQYVAGCRIADVDDKGFRLKRASGKAVRVTRRMIEDTAARLLAGETLPKHANRSKGGISYTSAIENTVIAALAGLARLDDSGRAWVLDREQAAGLEAA